MRHCCKFSPDDIYYLEDNNLYTSRKMFIGFCPICKKPVAELLQTDFAGNIVKESASGFKANDLANKHKDEIVYSMQDFNYNLFKSKPFGWKYGINKYAKANGKRIVKQFACDFYGNSELIKTIDVHNN